MSDAIHDASYLFDLIILLAAAIVAVPLFRRLGLGAILGYLAAGAAIGPWGLRVIVEVPLIRRISEFGVVFLLFLIGIELKPSRLWVMRRWVFGLGTAQVALTGIVLAGAGHALGIPAPAAVVVGFGLALSSTAFGLQILGERHELGSRHGRAAFAILLLQDLAAVPLFALIPLLSPRGAAAAPSFWAGAVQTIAVLAGVVLAGRHVMRPMLRLVAASRTPEVFAAAAVLVVLGAAALMEAAGLSMALGAFLAGLLLSDSEYRHQVQADIEPFRGFLLGLFFMAVGMSIDFGLLAGLGPAIAGLVLGLLAVKAAVLWPLGRLGGLAAADAGRLALLLAQGGEFAFALFGLAAGSGLIDDSLFRMLLLVVAVTMVLTPALVGAGHRLAARLGEAAPGPAAGRAPGRSRHVIIAGFGRVGQTVARMLAARGIPYTALDLEADRVAHLRARGDPVFYGHASRADVLQAAGAAEASLLVVTLDHPGAAERTVAAVGHHFPNLPVHARAVDLERSRALKAMGAASAVPETLEASLQLGRAALVGLGAEEEEVDRLLEEFRSEGYARLGTFVSARPSEA
jgi:monovalent cation:proton antiporter-2 (CPA2) family protein